MSMTLNCNTGGVQWEPIFYSCVLYAPLRRTIFVLCAYGRVKAAGSMGAVARTRLRIGQLFERQSNRDWIYLIRSESSVSIVPCEFFEELSRKKEIEERTGGGWSCGRIESVVANKVVLSRESRGKWRLIVERFPWIRQETRYDTNRSSNGTRTWQHSLFKSNNAPFSFSFSFFTVRQPTLLRIKGKRDKTCSETFRSIDQSSIE